MRPVSTSVIFGSRKPLYRSHNPGTLDTLHAGASRDRLLHRLASLNRGAVVQPPCGPSDVVLLEHETAGPADSRLMAQSHQVLAAYRVPLLDASSGREVSDMGRTRRQRTIAADDRWVNIWPRLATVHQDQSL
jgi:hypothetical protein